MDPSPAGVPRTLAADLPHAAHGSQVRVEGWVHRRRVLASVTFLVVRDRSGQVQVVVRDPNALRVVQECGEETVVAVAGVAGEGRIAGGPRGAGPCTARSLSVTFAAPDGRTVLLASWHDGTSPDDATALIEDAAHSLRMALEREQALAAHQEALALRQSQELQRAFLRRLSHELRTPLTPILATVSASSR